MDDIFNDLINVGNTKALGYLPLSTIEDFGGSIDELLNYAKFNNIKYLLLEQFECKIVSGALYFYDDKWLKNMVEQFNDILYLANVDISSLENMVRYIAKYSVRPDIYPCAYIVIGKMFNDHRFSNFTNEDIYNVTHEDILKIAYKYNKHLGLG